MVSAILSGSLQNGRMNFVPSLAKVSTAPSVAPSPAASPLNGYPFVTINSPTSSGRYYDYSRTAGHETIETVDGITILELPHNEQTFYQTGSPVFSLSPEYPPKRLSKGSPVCALTLPFLNRAFYSAAGNSLCPEKTMEADTLNVLNQRTKGVYNSAVSIFDDPTKLKRHLLPAGILHNTVNAHVLHETHSEPSITFGGWVPNFPDPSGVRACHGSQIFFVQHKITPPHRNVEKDYWVMEPLIMFDTSLDIIYRRRKDQSLIDENTQEFVRADSGLHEDEYEEMIMNRDCHALHFAEVTRLNTVKTKSRYRDRDAVNYDYTPQFYNVCHMLEGFLEFYWVA